MHWKDFLYYQKSEKIAVILLLILIVLMLCLNLILSQRNSRDIDLLQNDSLVKVFEEFQKSLNLREDLNDTGHNAVISGHDRKSRDRTDTRLLSRERIPERRILFRATEKLAAGETILLNSADTADWKRIPGIGSVFANRIVKYQNLLGGFVSVEQLREVYGIDDELFLRISPYIQADDNYSKLQINRMEFRELLKHPYLNYRQVQAIVNLRKKRGKIASINELAMLDEFTSEDIFRIEPYLEF
ncbi:putative protein {ECO:0000313/EMBL:CEA16961,1} [Petrimonas mucosa]|jgi:competence protein ComEA|uniref:Helix-hairpin-helix domain-containing protein n=1 Tax=Petrimonas mucosa TaxID=1642646 RepID=A0A1G4G3K2_9BACT|nr:putative protein {ECO:0000313/EMBL:CEA16961,1} [Petrimonas mucosa]SFU45833.1 Helix-hairpin-helix motif-containing protein [Porphyromonadaceae bacterium KHP3R9]